MNSSPTCKQTDHEVWMQPDTDLILVHDPVGI